MRFHFTNWRTRAGYAENSGSETPARTNPETEQQRLLLPPTRTMAWKHLLLISAGLRNPKRLVLGPRSSNYHPHSSPHFRPWCYSGRQAGAFPARARRSASRCCFQPTALPGPPASLCPARTPCCPGFGSSTFSPTAFSPPSLSGGCAANPTSTV